jgi:glycogen phosphorylase
MSKQTLDIDSGIALLRELALDLGWSWNHAADGLWSKLDPVLWERVQNPWVMLQTVSRRRLVQLLASPAFRETLRQFTAAKRKFESTWFQRKHVASDLKRVAYFSMEFMLSEALPIYAGGLGNVAGDQLKAASDLGVPVTGVGLLYSQGYFRQVIGADGTQQALFPYNDPGQLPIAPLRKRNGEWLRVEIQMPGYCLSLRAWQVKVGRLHLYLLDSNDIANYPAHRGITSELYGGDSELRLQQEIVLGLGGWRLLDALGQRPDVCHLNEGHAAFAVLDRARTFMETAAVSFQTALVATGAGNVFTSHTAVAAGFDRFAPQLMARYFARYAEDELQISLEELLALGRENASNHCEPFNMAYLAVRGCTAVNGVSELHETISRRIFLPLFARHPLSEVPVGHVTNGVHMPSWDGPSADALWTACCGKDRWRGSLESLGPQIRSAADPAVWQSRTAARKSLVDYARKRLSAQLAASGGAGEEVEGAKCLLNPDALTLGFARRFATYKRPNLLLHDPERLVRLLTNAQRPVQLIIAGKAHPDDLGGQALVREWVRFVRRFDVRQHAIFLGDYDMLLTERMVEGVDVWINTPQRPWEACGTSGMKVLVNGGLNLSELDGWWAEAYSPAVGWALGDGKGHGDDRANDALESAQLYEMLEAKVIPEFYARDDAGLPQAWLARIRESMASLTPVYSANRSVREYVEGYYLRAAAEYHRRTDNQGALAKAMSVWRRSLDFGWATLSFGPVEIKTRAGRHHFTVQVALGTVSPEAIRVELYADPVGENPAVHQEMQREAMSTKSTRVSLYAASVSALRPADHYTPRIVPTYLGVNVPLEAPQILWQR